MNRKSTSESILYLGCFASRKNSKNIVYTAYCINMNENTRILALLLFLTFGTAKIITVHITITATHTHEKLSIKSCLTFKRKCVLLNWKLRFPIPPIFNTSIILTPPHIGMLITTTNTAIHDAAKSTNSVTCHFLSFLKEALMPPHLLT